MRYTYDKSADAVFLYLVPEIHYGEVAKNPSMPIEISNASITLSVSADDVTLGIEFLGASRIFSEAALAAFERGSEYRA